MAGRVTEKYDNGRLLEIIDWEGGIEQAIDYGITPEQIEDPEVAEAWRHAAARWNDFVKERSELELLLEDWEATSDDEG